MDPREQTRELQWQGHRPPSPPTAARAHLDEGEHLVVHDGGRVVLGQDGLHQHALHEVLAGHQHVEAVPAVLDAGFQDLEAVRCP